MPKHNIFLKPGENIPEDIQQILNKYFNSKNIEKLEKFGGRIQISLTAPYTDRKQLKEKLIIDDNFLSKINEDIEFAKREIESLKRDQLKELAKYLNFPLSSKATIKEARKSLLEFLASKSSWKSISTISKT